MPAKIFVQAAKKGEYRSYRSKFPADKTLFGQNIPFGLPFKLKTDKMAVCIPFLGVTNVEATVVWYESLGFRCTGSNRYWDPQAELSWAQLEWENAAFMLFPFPAEKNNMVKDAGLFFRVQSLNDIVERLQTRARIIEITEEPQSGKREVVFEDLNGFRITITAGY